VNSKGGIRRRCKDCCKAGAEASRQQKGSKHLSESFQAYRKKKRANVLVSVAKNRAKLKGMDFNLDAEDVEMLQAQIDKGYCPVSLLPFNLEDGKTWDSPSLDRIDNSMGYVKGNVRVILFCLNVMANEWGLDKVMQVVKHTDAVQTNPSANFQARFNAAFKKKVKCLSTPEYVMTWKEWGMNQGVPILALRARARTAKDGLCVEIRRLGNGSSSEHPTSGSGCTGSHIAGWGTPSVQDSRHASMSPAQQVRDPNVLHNQVYLTVGSAYPSPQTASEETTKPENSETNAPSADSPTPKTANAPAPPMTDTSMTSATGCSTLVGWATPGARDHKDSPGMSETGVNPDGSIRNRLDQLGGQVGLTQPKQISGWLTPSANDDAAGLPGSKMQQMLGHQAKLTDPDGLDSGQTSISSPAATAKPGVLNAALPRWLQGYPVEWCQAAIRAARNTPTRRAKRG